MPDTPDLKALAERYLDLWEQQFSAAAADPALASAMAAWLAPWRNIAGVAPGNTQAKGDGSAADTFRKAAAAAGFAPASPAAGPAAARPASGDGGRGLDRILERLDAIERRLAALERKPQPKPAARRPKPGAKPAGNS